MKKIIKSINQILKTVRLLWQTSKKMFIYMITINLINRLNYLFHQLLLEIITLYSLLKI